MRNQDSLDDLVLSTDLNHPARAWLAFNEGGLIGGCPELAIHRIKDVGLQVRLLRAEESSPREDDRRDRVTLIIGYNHTVEAATAS